ncbi:MAG: DUF433 domain-containing protein [Candidatus Brocadia sp.]|nr:DUF433 domain-containing protein [Candidatus Brocadia sp.]
MKFIRTTVNPNQMGGVPCIPGLRIPVATVWEWLPKAWPGKRSSRRFLI